MMSKKSQPERYIFIGSTNDEAMNIIIEQLEASMETYTEIQAQEALDTARAAMRVLHAEEVYTIERLGQGMVQLRALENKVVEVKNRLRIAHLQMVFLRQKLVTHGFDLSDDIEQNFIERPQGKPLPHSPLTTSELARASTLPPPLADSPATTTDLLLQEPVDRLNVSNWTLSTLPGPPEEVSISENVDDNQFEDASRGEHTSGKDLGPGALCEPSEPDVDVTKDSGRTWRKAAESNLPVEGSSLV